MNKNNDDPNQEKTESLLYRLFFASKKKDKSSEILETESLVDKTESFLFRLANSKDENVVDPDSFSSDVKKLEAYTEDNDAKSESLLYRLLFASKKKDSQELKKVYDEGTGKISVQNDKKTTNDALNAKEMDRILSPLIDENIHQDTEVLDAQVDICISNDGLIAYITVYPPKNGGNDVTSEQIHEALVRNNVTQGIDDRLILNIIDKKQYGEELTIAQGIPYEDGEDGEVIEHFSRQKQIQLDADDNDKVDYKSLNLINNVKTGTVICDIKFPTKGTNGMSISGKPLKAKDGQMPAIPNGENTRLSDDKTQIISNIDGHIIYRNNKFNVSQIYHVPGNVDNSVGNIDFNGDVIVEGDMRDGYQIKAKGNVTVKGLVEGAFIYAGGDVTLKGGINGMRKGVIQSDGEIKSKFLENCTVRAKGSITAESIVNSEVYCDNKLIVTSNKGVITGGSCTVLKSVEAKIIGSPANFPTTIILGMTPAIQKEKTDIENELETLATNSDMLVKNLSYVTNLIERGNTDQQYAELKDKINKQKIMNMITVGKLKKRLEKINLDMADVNECIVTGKIIYPSVKITIGKVSLTVKTQQNRATFYLGDGEIKIK